MLLATLDAETSALDVLVTKHQTHIALGCALLKTLPADSREICACIVTLPRTRRHLHLLGIRVS